MTERELELSIHRILQHFAPSFSLGKTYSLNLRGKVDLMHEPRSSSTLVCLTQYRINTRELQAARVIVRRTRRTRDDRRKKMSLFAEIEIVDPPRVLTRPQERAMGAVVLVVPHHRSCPELCRTKAKRLRSSKASRSLKRNFDKYLTAVPQATQSQTYWSASDHRQPCTCS